MVHRLCETQELRKLRCENQEHAIRSPCMRLQMVFDIRNQEIPEAANTLTIVLIDAAKTLRIIAMERMLKAA